MSSALNVILIVSCFSVFIASATVTTIFQLEASRVDKGFKSHGTWKVVTSEGDRGFPVRRGNTGVSNVWAGQPCCEKWSHDGWTKLSQEEALRHNPPLVVDPMESSESRPVTKSSAKYKQDSDGLWRGSMDPDSRVKLAFVPPESGRAALAIYLCEFEEIRDDNCVSVVLTGSSSDGKTLRYRSKRPSTYVSETMESQGLTFNNPKEYVLSEEYGVHEGWQIEHSYHFRIARTAHSDLQVELDNGNPYQKHEMTVRGDFTYNKIMVSLLPALSDTARELRLTEDRSWQGDFSPGNTITVSFSPNSNNIGHLGFALCKDQTRDDCSAIVIDGIDANKLVRNDYWIAGLEEADKPIPDSSMTARWGKPSQTFMLSREYNGTVIVTMEGGVKDIWQVSADKHYVIVDTYHNQGTVGVNTNAPNITASVWRLDKDKGDLRSPPLPTWYVDGEVCVSVAARVSNSAEIAVSVQRFGSNKDSRVLEILKSEAGTQWIQKRIAIPPSRILRKNEVQIVLTAKQPAQTKHPVLVQWAAGCDPTQRRSDEVFVKEFVPSSYLKDRVGFRSNKRHADSLNKNFPPVSHRVCQNDGLLSIDGNCLCRPGFTGRLCERACGRNRFGDDCEGRCSDEISPRECRGMWLCSADLPCDCGPGLKGPHCDQPCEHGEYGVGCRQKCGQCAYGDFCDPYTGVCRKGCKGPLLPPFCKTECGRSSAVVGLIGEGGLARQVEYPWHVGIYDKKNHLVTKGDPEQICGGTLITPNVVVTAAHCFWDHRTGMKLPPGKYSVGVAKTKRYWNAKEEFPDRVQKRDVIDIHMPSEFHGVHNSKKYDIAVLRLATPIELTAFVVPACFDQVGGYEEDLRKGSAGRFPGWGRRTGNLSEDLHEGKLSYIFREDCLKIAPVSFRSYVTEDRLCAGEQDGVYISKGDSGGGLVFQQSGSWFLRGIASVSPNAKTFAAYTNASFYRNWIVNWIKSADLQQALIETYSNVY